MEQNIAIDSRCAESIRAIARSFWLVSGGMRHLVYELVPALTRQQVKQLFTLKSSMRRS